MQLYQDNFSIITRDAASGVLTLTWTEQTANMTDADFQTVNEKFADLSIEHQGQHLLVDVRKFGHTFGAELGDWRLRVVIPKYHQAGVTHFAFVHGAGFEAPPDGRKEAGENFITRHFSAEDEARTWLSQGL